MNISAFAVFSAILVAYQFKEAQGYQDEEIDIGSFDNQRIYPHAPQYNHPRRSIDHHYAFSTHKRIIRPRGSRDHHESFATHGGIGNNHHSDGIHSHGWPMEQHEGRRYMGRKHKPWKGVNKHIKKHVEHAVKDLLKNKVVRELLEDKIAHMVMSTPRLGSMRQSEHAVPQFNRVQRRSPSENGLRSRLERQDFSQESEESKESSEEWSVESSEEEINSATSDEQERHLNARNLRGRRRAAAPESKIISNGRQTRFSQRNQNGHQPHKIVKEIPGLEIHNGVVKTVRSNGNTIPIADGRQTEPTTK